MKKLLWGIGLALLPIVLYYGVFIAFEPNNYFGIKKQADGTDIMATLRAYEKQPGDSIILGDSRTAKFDLALAAEITGREWANLSYGGASLEEQLDILDWALAHNAALSDVLFMASFYPLNASYNHNRNVVAASQNPFIYMTKLGYNINMLTNLLNHLSPQAEVGDKGETEDPAKYVYVDYTVPATGEVVQMRKTMADHLASLEERSANWELNQVELERLLDTIAVCEARGIAFTVVLPPASHEVMEYIVQPYGIDEGMRPALAALHASGALVLDYEFGNQDLLRDDQFFDNFHLDMERGLDAWTQILFTELREGGAA